MAVISLPGLAIVSGKLNIIVPVSGDVVGMNQGGTSGFNRNSAMNNVLPDFSAHSGHVMYCDGATWKAIRSSQVGGGAAGSTVVDFGSSSLKKNDVSVIVSGGIDVLATSSVQSFFMDDATADNNTDAHLIASRLVTLTCEKIMSGVGFTIRGMTDGDVYGQFNVRWQWR